MFETVYHQVHSTEVVGESSIDFPQKDLCPQVWNKKGNSYTLRPDVKSEILKFLEEYPQEDLQSIAKSIRIVGSIGTNQYTPVSDIDVHITLKDTTSFSEELQKDVLKWSREKNHLIGKHPIEVYIQSNPNQDLMSDSCYDVKSGVWCAGPSFVEKDHDPYTNFSGVLDDLRSSVSGADELFGELRRDSLDFKAISDAMSRMDSEQKEAFKQRLESKLEEIQADIEKLYAEKDVWVKKRRDASKPTSPEEALNDVEKAKKWQDANAEFKFINRYNYLRVIDNLKKLIDDDGTITPGEVDQVRDLMKDMM